MTGSTLTLDEPKLEDDAEATLDEPRGRHSSRVEMPIDDEPIFRPPTTNWFRDPEEASPKLFTIVVRLNMPAKVEAAVRTAERSGPDYAAVRRIIAESGRALEQELKESLRGAGGFDMCRPLPRLHSALVRMPRRNFERWLRSAAGQRLVGKWSAIRNQRIRNPAARMRLDAEAVAASYHSGKSGSNLACDVLQSANILPLHQQKFHGQGQVIGLLDSGAAGPIAGSVIKFSDFTAQGNIVPAAVSIDNGRHGTQIGSIILQICPQAKLAVGAVLRKGPSGKEEGRLPAIVAGLQWLLDEATDGLPMSAVNISIDIQDASAEGYEDLLDYLRLAATQGVYPVLAIGNNSRSRSLVADAGLAIGALDRRGLNVASFSGRSPHLVAPGEKVRCITPGGAAVICSGTSKSSAIVAGALTLLVQASGKPVKQCVAALLQWAASVNGWRSLRSPKRWGSGPVDVAGALSLL